MFSELKELLFGPQVDYKQLISEGAIIVDVRSEAEFSEGNAQGSINIPMHELNSQMDNLKDKTVILVCRSGARASNAKSQLKKRGITSYNAGPWQRLKEIF